MDISIFVGVSLVIALFSAWYVICNERTFSQRQNIRHLILSTYIKKVFEDKSSVIEEPSLYDVLNSVSYRKHVLYLVFFLDPMKLYPKSIQELL